MSNHYEKTLDNIIDAMRSLLSDLISDIDDLTTQNSELVDENRKLELHAEREFDRGEVIGYDRGLDRGLDEGYDKGYDDGVKEHGSA